MSAVNRLSVFYDIQEERVLNAIGMRNIEMLFSKIIDNDTLL
jgi:hypothetical protein